MHHPLALGSPVIARIDGADRPAEIRGHCHKGVDLYDVMTADREIHCYLRAEHLTPAATPVLQIGRTAR
jgi:hypothetical protein